MEKEEIKTLVKEVLTEVVKEYQNANTPSSLGCNENWNFHITKIGNGFLIENYSNGVGERIFAETKEKAFELASEFVK